MLGWLAVIMPLTSGYGCESVSLEEAAETGAHSTATTGGCPVRTPDELLLHGCDVASGKQQPPRPVSTSISCGCITREAVISDARAGGRGHRRGTCTGTSSLRCSASPGSTACCATCRIAYRAGPGTTRLLRRVGARVHGHGAGSGHDAVRISRLAEPFRGLADGGGVRGVLRPLPPVWIAWPPRSTGSTSWATALAMSTPGTCWSPSTEITGTGPAGPDRRPSPAQLPYKPALNALAITFEGHIIPAL